MSVLPPLVTHGYKLTPKESGKVASNFIPIVLLNPALHLAAFLLA
jgi:hypothetical protein